jgi:hypothetical protein
MSRSDAPSGRDPHEAAQQSLPWLLAGTLEGDELAMVEEHVRGCERCQADLAWERSLRAAGCGPVPDIDPDRALQKLVPRLPPRAAGGKSAANDSHWLRIAAAAQLGVIAVLAALLLAPRDEASYRTLGTPGHGQGNVVIVFAPGTPERELRRILRQSGARVVDGPTVADAWVLAVPPAQARDALRRLRGEPSVTLAQPLGAESPP